MILQYKGSKNNWCYEESNTIIWSNVWVGDITKDYREGNKYDEYLKEQMKLQGEELKQLNIIYARRMLDEVNELIKKETNCADDIVYLIGDLIFTEMDNICVVTLKDKNKYCTYVFNSGVYILNNSGGTVQKIA